MRRAQGGVALVLVMWVGILLTVIASAFIIERRTDAMVVGNSISVARAEAIADAGVQRAIFEVYRNDNSPDTWKRDGTRYEMLFDNTPVSVEIRDESAKIDINTATDPLLRGLLVSSGVPDDEASRLLDAILDWRDPDDLKRPNGAEEPDYRAAGLTYKPANGRRLHRQARSRARRGPAAARVPAVHRRVRIHHGRFDSLRGKA